MRWDRDHRSENVEDRRGESGGGGFRGGLRGGAPKVGLGGLLVLGVLSIAFGRDFITPFLGGGGVDPGANAVPSNAPIEASAAEDEMAHFAGFVLDDCQATWTQIFTQQRQQYRNARLVLFRESVETACGAADAGVGPFYCPGDQKVYIDLAFYDELRSRFGAPGDFAAAYVIAHEVGHHIQNLLGTEREMRRLQQQEPDLENELSVKLELQADCYAGVWANSTQQRSILEAGDVEEAMGAASAVGDDSLQRQAGSRVRPETFTHGSSAQRTEWFQRGMQSGQISSCDTFGR